MYPFRTQKGYIPCTKRGVVRPPQLLRVLTLRKRQTDFRRKQASQPPLPTPQTPPPPHAVSVPTAAPSSRSARNNGAHGCATTKPPATEVAPASCAPWARQADGANGRSRPSGHLITLALDVRHRSNKADVRSA